MAQLTAYEVAMWAAKTAIYYDHLTEAVAIAWAESGLRDDAIGYNRDPDTHQVISRDRGLWQINDYWHSEVSDECAFNAACNARAMDRISSHGTNWTPWSTWNSGAYLRYMAPAGVAANLYLSGGQPPGPPSGGGPPPAPSGTVGDQAIQMILDGAGPIHTTAWLLQNLFDAAMDNKYGGGHRTGPIFGGIIK